MSSMEDDYYNEIEDYLMLCDKFNESPKFIKNRYNEDKFGRKTK